jgi:protocatechuate 3,4-dioxygenase beta subunit
MVEEGGQPMTASIAPLLLALATQLPTASPPRVTPRDEAPPRTGTGVIRGRITERDTDLPVARMNVRLFRAGWTRSYDTRTDEQGRFAFTRLPAGQYRVSAEPLRNRKTHLQKEFAEKPADPGAPPKPIQLADGEVREGVDIALVPLVTVSGRVLDENGDPLLNIRVQAEPLSRVQGVSTSQSRDTDDRGAFRVFGLVPGRYRICADVETGFIEQTEAFVRTCYPSTAIEDESPAVTLAAGENNEIEIRRLRTRVFTLSGTVLDVSGAPAASAFVTFSRILKDGASGGRGWQIDATGRFTVGGLPPGDYGIHASIGAVPYGDADRREPQAGYVSLALASDVENQVIAMTRPAKVAGRVIFEDGPPQRPLSLRVWPVDALSVYPQNVPRRTAPAPVREDLTFELENLYGQQLLIVEGLGREWVLKSVRYRNENITGLPVEYKSSADPDDLQIVLTSRVARVIARVVDETGKPAKDGRVMLFPADPRQWVRALGSVQQGIRQKDGSYLVGPMRAGEYLVVAPAADDVIETFDRSRLEALAKLAERITLNENEERQIELRVVRIP